MRMERAGAGLDRAAEPSESKLETMQKPNESDELPDCPICGRPVRYLMTAIAQGESGDPAHFDCVLKVITEHEEIQPREKVCYLGNGSFGIVRFKPGAQVRFTIRKRIQYEPKDKSYPWRKRISTRAKTR